MAAFRERQQADLKRWSKYGGEEGKDDDIYKENGEDVVLGKLKPKSEGQWDGVWRNEDGATLADYGVDEDAEGGMKAEDEEALRAYEAGPMSIYPCVAPQDGYAGIKERGKGKGKSNANGNARWSMGYDDEEEVSLAELMRRRRHAEERKPDDFGAGTPSLDVFRG